MAEEKGTPSQIKSFIISNGDITEYLPPVEDEPEKVTYMVGTFWIGVKMVINFNHQNWAEKVTCTVGTFWTNAEIVTNFNHQNGAEKVTCTVGTFLNRGLNCDLHFLSG